MTTKISVANIQDATLAVLGANPKISQVVVCDSSYNTLDDTAVALEGGYIKITGSGFKTGATVTINKAAATSVQFISSTELRAQVAAASAGTYVLYVVNTDGSVAVRVNAVTYSATPSWITGSTLADQLVDESISIQLSATSATTYTLGSGSSLPSGLTLSSGGLLSGTVTGVTQDTTYNFTIVAADAELQDSPRSFSVTITVGDVYWKYVTTLLSSKPATLPYNTDTSTNNIRISTNNCVGSNLTPNLPEGYYSVKLNGSSQALSVGSDAGFSFTGDFTIECWVYFESLPTGTQTVLGLDGTVGSTSWYIQVINTGLNFYYDGSTSRSGGTTIRPSTWYHIAAVRSGSTIRQYLNGQEIGNSYATSATIGSGSKSLAVGRLNSANYLDGYVSDIRIVDGTAIYTNEFIPPTAPLTAVTNTVLLLARSNTFKENFANRTVTLAGTPGIKQFSPYNQSTTYDTYGSVLVNSNGVYLSADATSALTLGSGDFCVEFWIYLTQTTQIAKIYASGTSIGNFAIETLASGAVLTVTNNSSTFITSSTALSVNTWTHVAVTRSGTTLKLFQNGVEVGSVSNSTDFTGTTALVGGNGTTAIRGYISNLRVVKGAPVYTAAFTPPSDQLTAISGTALLTCLTDISDTNGVVLDYGNGDVGVSRTGNAAQGTFSPYGENWSYYFDGTSDVLTVPDSTAFAFGTGNFTIEAWVYPLSTSTTAIAYKGSSTTYAPFGLLVTAGTGVTLYCSTGGTAWNITVTNNGSVPVNTWSHIAAVRNGSSFTVYINGVAGTPVTSSASLVTNALAVALGGTTNASFAGNAYHSNTRIVKGTAVYTANFTPPTSPLQPVAGTSLLTCQSNRLVDNSTNNFTITRSGDVSVEKFGPIPSLALSDPGYSAYFDGSGDYISVGSNIPHLKPGSGDFTVEFWQYCATSASAAYIYDTRLTTATSTGGFSIYHQNGTLFVYGGSTTATLLVSSVISYDTWNHIAVVRSGTATGNVKLYINGTLAATSTISDVSDYSLGYLNIGCYQLSGTASNFYTGYISNFRLSKNSAVYTANFTPPTTTLPITAATTLLTCHSNYITHPLENTWSLTANGNTKPSKFSPFSVAYATNQVYSPQTYGGSLYFDGTGDSITVTNDIGNNLGTSRYTIDFWVYPTAITSSERNLLNKNAASTYGYTFRITAANKFALYTDNTTNNITGTTTITPNQWYHVAATYDGTTTRLFVNGVLEASIATWSTISNDTTSLVIGIRQSDMTSFPYAGYLSDIRIIKGLALYTSNFIPPVVPQRSIRGTTLLLTGTDSAIYDSSGIMDVETLANSAIRTSPLKYGTTSMYFDGTGDFLALPTTGKQHYFRDGNFTVEFWMYQTSNTGTQSLVAVKAATAANSQFYINTVSGVISAGAYYSTTLVTTSGSTSISLNTWTHVALVRSGSTLTLYVDGVSAGTATLGTNSLNAAGANLTVGNGYVGDTTTYFGYISDLRVTRGIARYTGTFMPPSLLLAK